MTLLISVPCDSSHNNPSLWISVNVRWSLIPLQAESVTVNGIVNHFNNKFHRDFPRRLLEIPLGIRYPLIWVQAAVQGSPWDFTFLYWFISVNLTTAQEALYMLNLLKTILCFAARISYSPGRSAESTNDWLRTRSPSSYILRKI